MRKTNPKIPLLPIPADREVRNVPHTCFDDCATLLSLSAQFGISCKSCCNCLLFRVFSLIPSLDCVSNGRGEREMTQCIPTSIDLLYLFPVYALHTPCIMHIPFEGLA